MTCRRCHIDLKPCKALVSTLTEGALDFPGDEHASTLSVGGPGKLVDCLKCPECGHSVFVNMERQCTYS